MVVTFEKSIHEIVKNIDYALRICGSKHVLVASDHHAEGKSRFLLECIPELTTIYQKKILIYDCQTERSHLLETGLAPLKTSHPFIRKTKRPNLDYMHVEDLALNQSGNQFEHFSRDYEVVFINSKTLKRAEKTQIPNLPIDGAILIRSSKSIGKKDGPITKEILDRDIPILGLVSNEGT